MIPWTPLEARWRDALLAAMIPPDGDRPGLAELDLRAFWQAFEASAPPLLQLGLRAAVAALTLSPPFLLRDVRPFPLLSRAERDRLLEHASASSSFSLRQMVLLLKTVACFAYFREPSTRRAYGEPPLLGPAPAAALDVVDGAALSGVHRCAADIVVVGSGPAGATVARALARAGASVLVIEEGPLVAPAQFAEDAFSAMSHLYRDMGTSMFLGRSPFPFVQGRVVGGTSVVNGAISWRLPRDVHSQWVAGDPALEEALAWNDVEALTDAIESELSIAPTEASIAGPNNDLLGRGAEALGLAHRPISRNVRGCRGLGRCLQGCPEGNKMSMDRSYLPEACAQGARILALARVLRIHHRRGRAVGVEGVAASGARVVATAHKAVVLAASAIQTPVLLWQSGLRQGPVGENLQCHPGVSMAGYFDDPVRMWTGATQGHEVIGLRREGIKLEALGYDMAVTAMRLKSVGGGFARDLRALDHWCNWGAAIRAQSRGRVRPGLRRALVTFSLNEADLRTIRRGVRVLGEVMLAAGARYVTPGVFGWRDRVTDPATMARFEAEGSLDARSYALVATHLFGTCRMGSDPQRSVVRPDFRHHATEGLYVADSSVFPTNTGVNPQTSIIALAALCARSLLRG
jgi:choline dehydrogenase-like flavoprotein